MSHWDSSNQTIVRWPTELIRDHSDKRCKGKGTLFHRIPTGTLALYPGGPLAGSKRKAQGETNQ